MNNLDTRDPLEGILREALNADAERAPQLPSEWIGLATSSVADDRMVEDDTRVGRQRSEKLPRERHPRQRWMLAAAATIVVLAIGLLALAAGQDPDSVQTDTVPDTPAPSSKPATTSPSSTTVSVTTIPVPTTNRVTPVASSPATIAPATPTPDTMEATGADTTLGPASLDDRGASGILPINAAIGDAVDSVAGWHGHGHEALNALLADGVIARPPNIEQAVDCVVAKMFVSHDIGFQRLSDARAALTSAGLTAAEMTHARLARQMASDDPAAFQTDPSELTYTALVCAGMPDDQARAIAGW